MVGWKFSLGLALAAITTIVIQWQIVQGLRAQLIGKDAIIAVRDAEIQAREDAEEAVASFLQALQRQAQEQQAVIVSFDEVEGGSDALSPYLRSGAGKLWPSR